MESWSKEKILEKVSLGDEVIFYLYSKTRVRGVLKNIDNDSVTILADEEDEDTHINEWHENSILLSDIDVVTKIEPFIKNVGDVSHVNK